jgi:hypothetical protein
MSAPPETPSPRDGLTSSLLFWPCLLVAAGLYGAVATAPRLHQYIRQRDEYCANQLRLVEVESQVTHLTRVVEAFETDPTFAARLARTEFPTAVPGEERIPVAPDLALDGEPVPRARLPALSRWSQPLVEVVAVDVRIRRAALAIAALLVLFAFGALNDTSAQSGELAAPPRGWFSRRYFRHEKSDDPNNSAKPAYR